MFKTSVIKMKELLLPLVIFAFFGGTVFCFPPYSNDVYLQMALERAKDSAYPANWYNNPYADYGYPVYENYQQPEGVPQMPNQERPYSWIDMEVEPDWPSEELLIGQVAGVAVNSEDNPVLFHRADHPWDPQYQLFDDENNFLAKEAGPIAAPAVLTLDKDDGTLLHAWGENKFYMPHGITIDSANNLWLTDVAMHQVFKFSPGSDEPAMTLGKAFEPAQDESDEERFCKPTDVAVSSDGTIFVSDGYCNSRIARFSADGTFEKQFGEGQFNIPHSLALVEDMDMICVADRENKRIACFNAGLVDKGMFGHPMRQYDDPSDAPIYAIEYNPTTGLLFAVNGPTYVTQPTGFTVDIHEPRYSTDIVDVWSPFNNGFSAPHDVTTSRDGSTVFVGEISTGGNIIWKFVNEAVQINLVQDETEDIESNEIIHEDEEADEENEVSEEEMEEESVEEQDESEVIDEISQEDEEESSQDELQENENNEEEVEDIENEFEDDSEEVIQGNVGKEVETDERVIDSGSAIAM